MNKIIKFVVGAGVVAPFLMAGIASAATIPANTIFAGQTQVWGNAGQSVTATFRVNVAAGEVVHAIRTQVDSQATVCMEVGPFEGAQNVDVPVSITLPPNSNNSGYNLTAELFTTATLPQAQAMTGNLACTGANTNAYNGTNVVHVLPVSGSTSGTTGSSALDQLSALVASLAAQVAALLHPVTPVPTPAPANTMCTEFSADLAGLSIGSTGDGVAKLQAFLLSKNPNAIPLIRSGAATYGYFGNQTAAAVSSFRASNSCN